MLRNYFSIALRSLQRSVTYSFINIAGLSVGIAATILILLWVHDELTFNQYFDNYHSLYQVKLNNKVDKGIITSNLTPYPLKDALKQDSRIKNVAITIQQSALISNGETKIRKVGIDAAETFLEMFGFDMIHGDPASALNDPMSIVLTKSSAIALFGTDDVVGKTVTVRIQKDEDLKITGVIADPPKNISFNINFILPFSYFERTADWLQYAQGNWTNNSFPIYVQLQPGVSASDVDASIRDLIKKNAGEIRDAELFLHAMSRWRLYTTFENGKESGGLIDYIILFSCIAGLILLMACINFMNLATARSEHRAREVGIRKSIGSTRQQLILQFIGESVMISLLSMVIAIVIVEISLPGYNELVRKNLSIDFSSYIFWFGVPLMVIVTGLLAGSYPAFYLSAFKPSRILKSSSGAGKSGALPRQILVVVQNGFAILLIIGTAVVYQQITFLKDREPGYNQENLMLLWSNADTEKNYTALKNELLAAGAVESATKSNSPITMIFATSPIKWRGMLAGQRLEATNIATEYDYTKTMGIKLTAGRDFSPEYKSDTAAIVINRAAVRALNFENPIGEKIEMWEQQWTVIGVMEDVVMGSGSSAVEPLVMTMDPTWSTTISLRLPVSDDLPAAIKKIESIFKKYNPEYPFEFRFADDEFQQKFSSIEMVSKLAGSFALLAIFITSLGLFGMAAFSAEQRTKEIGIRKVLGASVASVLLLLSTDFSKLVIIAFVLAAPFAWWATTNFLQQYQLRIGMPYWIFPIAGIAALVITIAIASTQALRAATKNPVDSLRNE